MDDKEIMRRFENAKACNAIEGLHMSESDEKIYKQWIAEGLSADEIAKKIKEYLLPRNQLAAE